MTEDFLPGFEDQRPRTWLDAFPWLPGVAEPNALPMWEDAIDGNTVTARVQRLGQLSGLAMERLTQWTLGQIFPGLTPELNLLEIRLPARAVNALGSHGCNTAADLIPVRLEEMMRWRSVGVGTIDSILQALADASTSMATPAVTTFTTSSKQPQLEVPTPRLTSVIDDFKRIAAWYALVGLPKQPLLGAPLAPGSPKEVVEARQRLELLQARALLNGESGSDVAVFFDKALATLDDRAVNVLANRVFADVPLTLDELGRVHGITRERVRQIEGKARGVMLGFISEGGPLAMVADAARTLIGTIRPLEDLLSLIPSLGKTVEAVGQPAWRVLDGLDDAYEIEDGWCAVPTMQSAETVTRAQLEERVDQYGVARLVELDLIETGRPEQLSDLTASWLRRCGYIVEDDAVFTRVQSVGDYAAAVLSVTGSPMGAQEIVDRFVFDRTVGSLKNAMSQDDRFERIDRDRWALKEWGMEAYAGIRSVIREQVARNGGRANLNDLIEHITGRYTVTANSVVAYASMRPFEIQNGVVRQHSGDHEIRKTPASTRRLFRRPDAWAYRVRISTDHLRGSGSVAPVGIAAAVGLQPGESRQLPSSLGPQLIAWTGTQPSFGTIRRFLMDQDIAAGTEAFLVLGDDGGFSFEPAREPVGEPLSDALSLVGAGENLDPDAARRAFAVALEMPESTPVIGLIGAYRERGDDDIAELLISLREHLDTVDRPKPPERRGDIEDILDLL
ncbi:sigma factor-like helix-turn-helix DNA-binding protein [Arthrobacter sp. StoSoilB13]|uniref:sigma factor-like helix-turn-helix DNA-binding protein n=1 Tax=Arthrobacter sp. StoSoilB13 TaxID=2830993 RepID=UPI001CC794E5|nr:sigma factor-like helix-turn-helix DNA-binding protein [Arthrobacter sp. StoSoilB13]BCW52032.1 hypothetical protein StoSoilB13_43740 [Arthrobacter sp. StoSoilB13]